MPWPIVRSLMHVADAWVEVAEMREGRGGFNWSYHLPATDVEALRRLADTGEIATIHARRGGFRNGTPIMLASAVPVRCRKHFRRTVEEGPCP